MNQTIVYCLFLFGVFSSSSAQENWQITLSSGDTLSHVGLLQLVGDSLEVGSHGTNKWIDVASLTEVCAVHDIDVWGTAADGAKYTGVVAAVTAAVAIAISAHSSPVFGVDPGNTTVKTYGALAGAVVYGAAFGLLGGTIAGMVALVQNQDDVYDLSHTSLKGKQYVLQTILKE